jgi:hypothetical protein
MGYAEIMIFVAVLLAALAYLWRSGALDWSAEARAARTAAAGHRGGGRDGGRGGRDGGRGGAPDARRGPEAESEPA